MKTRLKQADTRRFNKAVKIINTMSQGQARFALLLMNQELRGYLGMPERQQTFVAALDRAMKARD